ncbi:MAG: NAD-dependent epimerase/dehydratase family protein [Calditrichaeota bacterium]|nr:MAG: NAD-dependent epimerase/dehydratase family protein [Calditrichota bacterium]
MAADAIMVNVAYLLALMLRYLWATGIAGNEGSPHETLQFYLDFYLHWFWAITLISLAVFYASGFYTYGKAYRSKLKPYVIFQAVSVSYLLFGAFVYFAGELFELPRGAYFLAWGFTLMFMIGSRLWSSMWRSMVKEESKLLAYAPQKRVVEKVLVIGGAGYIGSALLPKLLEKGYKVRLLDRLMFGMEPIAEYKDHPRLEIMQADFRQVDRVVEAMQDVDAVIHLGAIVGDPACALNEELTIDINLMATRMIAEVAKGRGVERFIFASTCSVYGASDDTLNEESKLNPVSLYARSKIASERVLMQMADERFAPVILRFATIYGLSGRTRFDLVVNLLTAKAVVEGKITVFGGNQWRPFVHVDDAALAVYKALRTPLELVNGEIFNVGSDEQNYTINDIARLIHQIIPNSEIVNMGDDTDARNYRVSFQKIRKVLGFLPQWTVEQGIRQVEEALRTGKVKDYRDARYSNVKSLSESTEDLLVYDRPPGWHEELLTDTSPVIPKTRAESK